MSYAGSVNIALEPRPADLPEQYRLVPASLEALQDLAMQEVQLSPREVPSLGTTRAIAEVAIMPYLSDGQDNGQGGRDDTEIGKGDDGTQGSGESDNGNGRRGSRRFLDGEDLAVIQEHSSAHIINAKGGADENKDNGKTDTTPSRRPGGKGGGGLPPRTPRGPNGEDPNRDDSSN